MTDYVNHLFPYVPPERLDTFSYGHVIPPENLMAISLPKGIGGLEFDFTYDARDSEKMVWLLRLSIISINFLVHSHLTLFAPLFRYSILEGRLPQFAMSSQMASSHSSPVMSI